MKLSIVITGSEFVSGTKQDTNSVFFAKEAFEKGLDVSSIHICKDDIDEISHTIKHALELNDIVIVSGGLGPTFDDVTRDAVALAVNEKLVYDDDWLEYLKKDYQIRNVEFNTQRMKMALRLENSKPIPNKIGKALGFIYQKGNKTILVLPGIPSEAKEMFNSALNALGYDKKLREVFLLRTFGLKESDVSELVKKFDGVFLNVSAKGTDVYTSKDNYETIKQILGTYVYAEGEHEMEEIVGNLLKKHSLTVSTAESSTGGLIISRLINIAGSSDYTCGGVVSYSNEAKMNILGVKKHTLDNFGAVSCQTAQEMLFGAKKLFNSDIVVCDTGIAGPTGATLEKSVGLHYIGIMFKDKVDIYKEIYQADRNNTRLYISQYALNLIRMSILNFSQI